MTATTQPNFAIDEATGHIEEEQIEAVWNEFYADQPNEITWNNLGHYARRFFGMDVPIPTVENYLDIEALFDWCLQFGPLTIHKLKPGELKASQLPELMRPDIDTLRYTAKLGPPTTGQPILARTVRSAAVLAVTQMLRELAHADNNRPRGAQH